MAEENEKRKNTTKWVPPLVVPPLIPEVITKTVYVYVPTPAPVVKIPSRTVSGAVREARGREKDRADAAVKELLSTSKSPARRRK